MNSRCNSILTSRLTLISLNQLWMADITSICLRMEFVYLEVLLDGYLRKVVGWALDKTLATSLPPGASYHTITARRQPPGRCITRVEAPGIPRARVCTDPATTPDDSDQELAGQPV